MCKSNNIYKIHGKYTHWDEQIMENWSWRLLSWLWHLENWDFRKCVFSVQFEIRIWFTQAIQPYMNDVEFILFTWHAEENLYIFKFPYKNGVSTQNMQMKTFLCTRLNQTLLVERVLDVKHSKIGKLKKDKFSILDVWHMRKFVHVFVRSSSREFFTHWTFLIKISIPKTEIFTHIFWVFFSSSFSNIRHMLWTNFAKIQNVSLHSFSTAPRHSMLFFVTLKILESGNFFSRHFQLRKFHI